jgi:glycogen debranching enzyme
MLARIMPSENAREPDATPPAAEDAAPVPQDIRDVLTLKHEGLFLLTDRFGDVIEGSTAALGMYFRDTRFLSCFELRIDGRRPLWLHAEADRNYSMLVETTMTFEHVEPSGTRHIENVQVSRHGWLERGLREEIRLRNFGVSEREVRVEMRFGADFLDLFEVRGMIRDRRGTVRTASLDGSRVTLGYDGRDGSEWIDRPDGSHRLCR